MSVTDRSTEQDLRQILDQTSLRFAAPSGGPLVIPFGAPGTEADAVVLASTHPSGLSGFLVALETPPESRPFGYCSAPGELRSRLAQEP